MSVSTLVLECKHPERLDYDAVTMATDMSSLQTYVDERTKRKLKYIGLVDGQSVSDIVRDLITRYVADWRDADGRPAPELP